MNKAFSLDCKKTEVLIQLVQNNRSDSSEGMVRAYRLRTVIPAGHTKCVKCSVRTVPFPLKREVVFEPIEIRRWPDGLIVAETIIQRQKGSWSQVTIPVTNDNSYITLPPRMVLGYVQQVKAVYLVEAKPAQISSSEQLNSSEKRENSWSRSNSSSGGHRGVGPTSVSDTLDTRPAGSSAASARRV